jgi:molybdopterin converting factor subunit 1
MIVDLKMFALAAELVGGESIRVELPDGATVGQLRRRLAEAHPSLEKIAGHVMFAVDAQYATDEMKIPAGAQIACIPPVSGG